MFTTVAWSESQDPGGVFTRMAAVADQHLRTDGDAVVVPEMNLLLGSLACVGTTGAQVRFVAPSIRRINPHYITPVELDIYPNGTVHHAVDPSSALPLDVDEGLEVEENSDPAAAEVHSVVAWLGDNIPQPITGQIFSIRFNITLALVASTWGFSEITLIDELPIGNYSVVGARFEIDEGVVARFVPVGGYNRPGAPCNNNVENGMDGNVFRRGKLGEWFQFSTIRLPSVEVLGSAAEASDTYECYMDVIKL